SAEATMEWRAGWDACRVEYPRTAPPSAPVVGGLIEAAKAAESMLRTVHECASHDCEDCREYAGIHAKHLRDAIAQQPAQAAPGAQHGDDAGDGLRWVMCQFGTGDHYRDMLLIPHADGQYVTAAKLQPFGAAIMRAQLA